MAMKHKRDNLEEVGTKNSSKKQQNLNLTEKQLRAAARAALKKADRFWRLAEKAPNENYREYHMKQARVASEVATEKTRQAYDIRTTVHEKV
jgi:hypothetical protein